jgi:hypothetical protein
MPVFKTRKTAMEYGDKLADHLVSYFEKQYKKSETWFLMNDEYAKLDEVLSSWAVTIENEGGTEAKVNINMIETHIKVSGTVNAHAARVHATVTKSPLTFKAGAISGVMEFSGSYNSTEKFESVKACLTALLIHHCNA